MLSVWKENMFCSFTSCTIILKFKHEPISILSREVYILNTLTYLNHSDVFTTSLHFSRQYLPFAFDISLLLQIYKEIVKRYLRKSGIHDIIMDIKYVLMLWISNSSGILNFAYVFYLILLHHSLSRRPNCSS